MLPVRMSHVLQCLTQPSHCDCYRLAARCCMPPGEDVMHCLPACASLRITRVLLQQRHHLC